MRVHDRLPSATSNRQADASSRSHGPFLDVFGLFRPHMSLRVLQQYDEVAAMMFPERRSGSICKTSMRRCCLSVGLGVFERRRCDDVGLSFWTKFLWCFDPKKISWGLSERCTCRLLSISPIKGFGYRSDLWQQLHQTGALWFFLSLSFGS